MNKSFTLIMLLIFGCLYSNAQNSNKTDSLGLPGDNLNLYAVMTLFQNSPTLEEFEKKLNEQDSKVNNLDLNNDNKVDYIRVVDNVDKNIHNIVLQVPINEKENQDVATFIVEKKDNGKVDIQLIGDEDLYGKDYIIEPNYKDATASTSTPNPGYIKQSSQTITDSKGNTTIINNYNTAPVATWPVVSYMYMPTYTVWVSPWRWYYYPTYWTPWTPWYWHRYYGYHYNYGVYYYGNYRYCHNYFNPYAYRSYYSRRSTSVVININLKSGAYRNSYGHPESRSEGRRDYYRNSNNRKKNERFTYDNSPIKRGEVKRESENSPKKSFHQTREIQTREKQSNRPATREVPGRAIENSGFERKAVERKSPSREIERGGGGRKRPR